MGFSFSGLEDYGGGVWIYAGIRAKALGLGFTFEMGFRRFRV